MSAVSGLTSNKSLNEQEFERMNNDIQEEIIRNIQKELVGYANSYRIVTTERFPAGEADLGMIRVARVEKLVGNASDMYAPDR